MDTLAINPVLFEIGSLQVRWYGIILGMGALVGLLLAVREGKRFGIKPEFFMDLLLLGAPSAIIAARIYYVAFKWDDYKAHPFDIIKIWEGGIAIYGAIIGAFICGIIYCRYKGYSFWRIADICMPSLLTGQMIGRWGNFMNQEAYGGPVSEEFLRNTLHIPSFIVNHMFIVDSAFPEGAFRHPAFLYESLWSLVGLFVLFVLRRQKFLRAGELMGAYFIWYSVGRFFIEALRIDSLAFIGPKWLADFIRALWTPMDGVFAPGYLDPAYGNIRISQLLALLLIVAAIIFVVARRVSGAANVRYSDPIYTTKPERNGEPAAEPQAATNGAVAGTAAGGVAGADAAAEASGGAATGNLQESREEPETTEAAAEDAAEAAGAQEADSASGQADEAAESRTEAKREPGAEASASEDKKEQ